MRFWENIVRGKCDPEKRVYGELYFRGNDQQGNQIREIGLRGNGPRGNDNTGYRILRIFFRIITNLYIVDLSLAVHLLILRFYC
jgi:hypothetical protein